MQFEHLIQNEEPEETSGFREFCAGVVGVFLSAAAMIMFAVGYMGG